MFRILFRIATMILAAGPLLAASNAARAQNTLVRLTFTGTGTQTGVSNPKTFSGAVQYDSSLPATSTSYFDFTGNTAKDHEICCLVQGGQCASAINTPQCDPYYIHTSANGKKLFVVEGTAPNKITSSPATVTVTVSIPAANNTTFGASLPACPPAGTDPFSTNSGTLTVTNVATGAVIFTGSIATVTCSQPALGSHVTCPTLPSPAVVVMVSYIPEPCPAYACPPRRSSCLSGLFARLCRGRGCW